MIGFISALLIAGCTSPSGKKHEGLFPSEEVALSAFQLALMTKSPPPRPGDTFLIGSTADKVAIDAKVMDGVYLKTVQNADLTGTFVVKKYISSGPNATMSEIVFYARQGNGPVTVWEIDENHKVRQVLK